MTRDCCRRSGGLLAGPVGANLTAASSGDGDLKGRKGYGRVCGPLPRKGGGRRALGHAEVSVGSSGPVPVRRRRGRVPTCLISTPSEAKSPLGRSEPIGPCLLSLPTAGPVLPGPPARLCELEVTSGRVRGGRSPCGGFSRWSERLGNQGPLRKGQAGSL